jgi:hypothetical protein
MQEALELVVANALQTPACIASREAPEAEDGPAEAEVTLLPHEGFVFLDTAGKGKFCITHTLSTEQHTLPAGHRWALIHDADGFAAVLDMDNDDMEPIIAEDLLRFAAYTTESGDVVLMDGKNKASDSHVNLKHFMNKYLEYEVKVECAPMASAHGFQLYGLKWPRSPAATTMWSAKSIYEALGLKQFGGQQWRWTWGGYASWKKHLASFGLEQHILRSSLMKAAPPFNKLCVSRCFISFWAHRPYERTNLCDFVKYTVVSLPMPGHGGRGGNPCHAATCQLQLLGSARIAGKVGHQVGEARRHEGGQGQGLM